MHQLVTHWMAADRSSATSSSSPGLPGSTRKRFCTSATVGQSAAIVSYPPLLFGRGVVAGVAGRRFGRLGGFGGLGRAGDGGAGVDLGYRRRIPAQDRGGVAPHAQPDGRRAQHLLVTEVERPPL